ncbi:hypothetical protein [Bradyrhizobium sp. CCBAU 11386]|uniref:hypothetical protein n=1 Tax=Bradyrhizobium sp. CCBAU 11386 TaxID=1630837 RepID=UPI003FA47062
MRACGAAVDRVAIETNAGAGIGAADGNYGTALSTILDFAREVLAPREMLVKLSKRPAFRRAQLQENRIVLTYLNPYLLSAIRLT